MATLNIDTNQFIENLVKEGLSSKQAKAIASGLRKIDLQHVASKEDIILLNGEMEIVKAELGKFATKEDLLELKVDMLKWVLPILLAQSAITVGLIKLLLL